MCITSSQIYQQNKRKKNLVETTDTVAMRVYVHIPRLSILISQIIIGLIKMIPNRK